jgi:integrase
MPLKLKPPRQGKTPYWYVRGTYLRVYVDRSTGSRDKKIANKVLRKTQDEIERGLFSQAKEPLFTTAATAYMKGGGDRRFLVPLLNYFGETPLSKLDQKAIDNAALELYPIASAATRNRQVYTVVSAILKHAGVDQKLKRPKGGAGKKRTEWLEPQQAYALVEKASERDREFGIFLLFLLHSGLRLSEATGMEIDRLNLEHRVAYIPTTKNGEPRGVHLTPDLVEALHQHPRGLGRPGERVFRFRKNGRLYTWLDEAARTAGIVLPAGSAFHVLRHTWATWMRRYCGLDTSALVATGAWADRTSAARYEHVVATEEARRADQLPRPPWATRGVSVEGDPDVRKTA